MDLEPIDKKLLEAIYEKDFNNVNIDWNSFNFESNNHKAFHLKRLERLGFIQTENNAFILGGKTDPKYGLAVVMVFEEYLHITKSGMEAKGK